MPITNRATMMIAAMMRMSKTLPRPNMTLSLLRLEPRDGAVDVPVLADDEDAIACSVRGPRLVGLDQHVMGAPAEIGGLGFGRLAPLGLAADDGRIAADQLLLA